MIFQFINLTIYIFNFPFKEINANFKYLRKIFNLFIFT